MREASTLGILAGLLIIAVVILAFGGFDGSGVTTALTAALSTVVGVLVAVYRLVSNTDRIDGGGGGGE